MIFNRNLHVAVLVAAMLTLGAQASLVTSNEVVDAVSAWAAANGKTFDHQSSAVATSARPTFDDDGSTVLYWTVTMSDGGAVIASPDTDLDLVVAFLEKHDGVFPEGHPLPSILKRDMKNRLAVLAQRTAAQSGGGRRRTSGSASMQSAASSAGLDSAVSAANRQWAKYGVGGGGMRLMGETLDDGDASPYVRCVVDGFEENGRYTHWNQSTVDGRNVYNYYTPEKAVCGCVATAGAAILQFFNCTNDVGVVVGAPTYGAMMDSAGNYRNDVGPCNRTIPGAIDWSILPATSYGGTNATTDVLTDECRKLLGRVTYNIGVLVNMAWDLAGPGTESGSHVKYLVDAFKQFGFKTSRCVEYSKDTKTDGKEFFKTIYAQLWCGAPVVLGVDGPPGGHAVVGCGYARDPDGDEFCRVFMGWSGKDDAWYRFPKVQEFNIVDYATTMIGYQDDAVVPVYGEANIPGVDLTLPGYVTNGVAVTVPVNENGYFGIRVPVTLGEKKIVYEPRNKSMDIAPFEADVIERTDGEANVSNADLAELDAALPEELAFSILNAAVKSTIESGRAVAERDGKALLMVSGMPGTPRTKALMEYLYWLDDTTDFSNKFVLVFNNIKSTDANRPDGNPGIGVFDPAGFEVSGRWQDVNERLSYNAFIDFDASGETNEVVYTFSGTNTVVMTNGVAEVLAVGYDAYLRLHSGISLAVAGVEAESGTNAFEVATVVPTYGVYTNVWTNGEMVVLSAPGTITNVEEGTIVSCVGWTTNEPFAYNMWTREWELQPYNEGNEVELQLFAGDDVRLTWIWGITHYRVQASTTLPLGSDGANAVTPADSWVRAGDRIAITAKTPVLHRNFSSWEVYGSVDYISDTSSEIADAAALSENGTSVWFRVNEPVTVKANYSGKTTGQSAPETVPIAIIVEVEPEELLEGLKEWSIKPLIGEASTTEWKPLDFDWGTNWVTDAAFCLGGVTLPVYVDETNGVWNLTGASGKNIEQLSDGILRAEDPSAPVTLVLKWELQTPEDPPEPEPGPISIKSLEKELDGSWTVTVDGAVADCWYWLYATDDLADFAGDEAAWTASAGLAATAEDNPQQATADGEIVFHATTGGAQLFWRARATSTEDGD